MIHFMCQSMFCRLGFPGVYWLMNSVVLNKYVKKKKYNYFLGTLILLCMYVHLQLPIAPGFLFVVVT